MIGTLAKLKEICQWWKERYDGLYAFVEDHGHVEPDYYIHELKGEYEFECSNFSIDIYTREMIDLVDEAKAVAEYMPQEVKAAYWELHAEMLSIIGEHIRRLKNLQYAIKDKNTNFKQIEYHIDSSYDYFIDRFDALKGALRCMKIDKSIREILSDEEAQKNHYLQSLEYRNRIISMYRDGLEDIEKYLTEHASEHDGYQIKADVSDIIRDVEKAVDKAGEL